jgi:SAM-dependent methyltransferase
MRKRSVIGTLAMSGLAGVALYWRKNPSACPYAGRLFVEVPHPLITRSRLHCVLAPQAGEELLEVGPGTGYYSLEVARSLLPGGTLDVLDLQRAMLDHTMRKAFARSLVNLTPTQGDARDLPYEDDRFDGAYLVTVLGEIPDQARALEELHRVVRHGGRVVVGELFGDPHMVSYASLLDRAVGLGLQPEERVGGRLGYFARFRVNKGAKVTAKLS